MSPRDIGSKARHTEQDHAHTPRVSLCVAPPTMSTAVRDIFARVPRTYALVNHVLTMGLDTWWRRKMARLAAAGGPGLCLDACTGTGDMARALIHAVENSDRMKDEIYNVGSEELNHTKEDVALVIQKKVQYQLYYADFAADPDKRDYAVSYDKIQASGFQVQTSLDQVIDELIAGCRMITLHNPNSNIEG